MLLSVVPGTPCIPNDPVVGDVFCQTTMANGYCSATTNKCRCPSEKIHIPIPRTCHMEVFTESCGPCRMTGGRCYDSDADGTPDGCECPPYRTSSSNNTLTSGCDTGLGETCVHFSFLPPVATIFPTLGAGRVIVVNLLR